MATLWEKGAERDDYGYKKPDHKVEVIGIVVKKAGPVWVVFGWTAGQDIYCWVSPDSCSKYSYLTDRHLRGMAADRRHASRCNAIDMFLQHCAALWPPLCARESPNRSVYRHHGPDRHRNEFEMPVATERLVGSSSRSARW